MRTTASLEIKGASKCGTRWWGAVVALMHFTVAQATCRRGPVESLLLSHRKPAAVSLHDADDLSNAFQRWVVNTGGLVFARQKFDSMMRWMVQRSLEMEDNLF
jgi:hypothetical protein